MAKCKHGQGTAFRETRFKGLGFAFLDTRHWQFIDAETGAQIGPIYPTKGELLADLERFAQRKGLRIMNAPRYFETFEQAKTFMHDNGAVGFVHPTVRGFIVVIMFEGLMWAMMNETQMMHLEEW